MSLLFFRERREGDEKKTEKKKRGKDVIEKTERAI